MKILQSSFFRAICAIAVGALLFTQPDKVAESMVIIIGIVFIISGIVSCLAYFFARSKNKKQVTLNANNERVINDDPAFPIVGIGSAALGFVLALKPHTFIESLMYILGAIVLISGASQLYALIKARPIFKAHFTLWIVPILLLLAGLFIIVKPFEVAVAPILIIGIAFIFYGVMEIVNTIIITKKQKDYDKKTTPQIVEEIENKE